MLALGIFLKGSPLLLAARKYLYIVLHVKHEDKRKGGYLRKRWWKLLKKDKEYQYASLKKQLDEIRSSIVLSCSFSGIPYSSLICSTDNVLTAYMAGLLRHCLKLSEFSPSFILPNNTNTNLNIHFSLQIKIFFSPRLFKVWKGKKKNWYHSLIWNIYIMPKFTM